MEKDILELLNNLDIKKVSKEINVSIFTIKRWKKNKKVPISYKFDLMKMNNIKIDYEKYNPKEKDQFYTSPDTAKYCFNVFCKKLKKIGENEKEFQYIEPSAGNGNFLKILPKDRSFGLDIEPRGEKIKKQDYFTFTPKKNIKYCVIGNPPFGLRGNLALRFINHSKFAEFVCFILPQLFESDGKGVPRKRVKEFNLIHSEKIENDFYYPDNKKIKINCIFQIWSKKYNEEKFYIKENSNKDMKIYSLSDGGTPSSTRNKKMLNKCDIYLPSTCFGKEIMKFYDKFSDLPCERGYGIIFNNNKKENIKKFKNIKWNEVAFLSTNSSYNIRTSQIYEALK